MNNMKFMNIINLMSTYNFDFYPEIIPDNLKCLKCKSVLKDASQVPCGCIFCRICIDDMRLNGNEFCPGRSQECGETLLSEFITDFRTNKNISQLIVKCPYIGCLIKSELINLEDHMQECSKKSVECSFYKYGCQKKFGKSEMNEHYLHENHSHNKILIDMIADMHKEIDKLKVKLAQKDEQINTIMDQMVHFENENKSLKDEIQSIRDENDLSDRVQILSEKIDREADERHVNDEREHSKMIEYVDKEILAIRKVIGSNKYELETDIKSVGDGILLINEDTKSINENIDSIKSKVQSIQTLAGQIDASYEWVIDEDIEKTSWADEGKLSECFSGLEYPYKYRLASWNGGITGESLQIWLRIYNGPSGGQRPSTFTGTVAITVADKCKRDLCRSSTQQCRIEKSLHTDYSCSDFFVFPHSLLVAAGLDLRRGVLVSCMIVPISGTDTISMKSQRR